MMMTARLLVLVLDDVFKYLYGTLLDISEKRWACRHVVQYSYEYANFISEKLRTY